MDNLIVFLIIMSAFKVPVIHQHHVLLIGIVVGSPHPSRNIACRIEDLRRHPLREFLL